MEQVRWFDRQFNFPNAQNTFPSILERLRYSPYRLEVKLAPILPEILVYKPNGLWSIQEHLGHLIDLEPLWIGRLEDILAGERELRHADLDNRATHEAGHNEKPLRQLLEEFGEWRGSMMKALSEVGQEEVFLHALHPRLKKPMRVLDLFYFVAEHDDHHLAAMTDIYQRQVSENQ